MRKLKFSQDDKKKLIAEFSKKLDIYEDELDKDEVSFNVNMKEPAKDKIVIYFTPEAYLRSQALVKNYTGEVGWNGLIRKLSDRTYLVFSIMVYPQVVNGTRTIDPTKTNDWYEKYEDVLEYMHYQAHSHNTMGTTPSGTDMNYYTNAVKNMQGEGFKLFQIWNKSGDINSLFYDLDNNLVYDRNDIEIRIQDSAYDSIDMFVEDSKELVDDLVYTKPAENKVTSIAPKGKSKYHWENPVPEKEYKDIENPFYWYDGYTEGWNAR